MREQADFDPFSYGAVPMSKSDAVADVSPDDLLFAAHTAPAQGQFAESASDWAPVDPGLSGIGHPHLGSDRSETPTRPPANAGAPTGFGLGATQAPMRPPAAGQSIRRQPQRPLQQPDVSTSSPRSGAHIAAMTTSRTQRKSFATGKASAAPVPIQPAPIGVRRSTGMLSMLVAFAVVLVFGSAAALSLFYLRNVPLAVIAGGLGVVGAAFSYIFLRE